MSFPRYPKYNDSGVEWLGEVPEGWGVAPLKIVASHNDDTLDERTHPDTEILYVDISSVDALDGIKTKEPMLFSAAPSRARRRVKHGDTIVSTVRTYLRAIARVREPEVNLVVSTGFAVVRPRFAILPDYLGNVLSACYFIEQVIARSTGVGYPAINASDLVRIPVAVPPLAEQTAIAEFLDRETKKIDELVAEQRRLMELLKEKRQAVISRAVTKGLNPHAPMKCSGIESLGDVPQAWDVKPLRSVFKFSKGLTITKEDLQDVGVHCVNYGEIHSKYGFILNPEIHSLRCVSHEYLGTNPEALIGDGDFVFADTSEDLAGSGNFTHLRSDKPIFAGYHTIIGRPYKSINSLFLAYQIQSSAFRSQIQRQVKGVKVFSISQYILKTAKCVMPPLAEQKAISRFLESETEKFDSLTAESQRAIDLLQERRTALISAAVSGQIDVRQQPRT